MVQKRETKAINKLCVREILSLPFLCGAYFFEFRGRNLVCFVIAYNFNGKYAPEAGKTRMRTTLFTRAGLTVWSCCSQQLPRPQHNVDSFKVDPVFQHCFVGERGSAN